MFSILLSKRKSNFKFYGINWGKTLNFLFGFKLRVIGRENFDKNKQYIFAPNHSSIIDFQVLYVAVNQYLAFVAKKELDKIPIFGTIIRTAGFVLVDRGNNKEAIKSLESLKLDMYKYPRSVCIFPEGTRTKNGKLQDFKKGAAVLGIDTALPIVPVAIIGSYSWLNRSFFAKEPNVITVAFGSPIETKNSVYEDRNDITMKIKKQIVKLKND